MTKEKSLTLLQAFKILKSGHYLKHKIGGLVTNISQYRCDWGIIQVREAINKPWRNCILSDSFLTGWHRWTDADATQFATQQG